MSAAPSNQDKIQYYREGGNVQRCHVVPHHGEYTVGKHSFDAVTLLLLLHPDPSLELVKAVLWHDVAERSTGDIPATAKWAVPALQRASEDAEDRVNTYYDMSFELSDEDRKWLSAVDKIELLLWAYDQDALGNRHTTSFITKLRQWIGTNWENIPVECQEFIRQYKWKRMEDWNE